MDDTQKNQQNQNANYTSDGAIQSGTPVQNTPAIGSVHREIERPVGDFVKSSEPLPIIDAEVKESGVDAVNEKIALDAVHAQIGVKHSGENTEPNLAAHKNIKFPLSDEDIRRVEKDDQASAYWLSVLIGKIKKVLLLEKN